MKLTYYTTLGVVTGTEVQSSEADTLNHGVWDVAGRIFPGRLYLKDATVDGKPVKLLALNAAAILGVGPPQ